MQKKIKFKAVSTLLGLIFLFCSYLSQAQYCQPQYTNGTGFGVFTTTVLLDSLFDSTGASASPYYTYDTTKTTSLFIGNTYKMSISPGTLNNSNSMAVWIDFNVDGDFTDAGEKLTQMNNMPTNATRSSFNFTVPCGATLGKTRMRVRNMFNNNNTNMASCTTYGYGETQDYNITLLDNPLQVASSFATQYNNYNVGKGLTKQELLCLKVFVAGCSDTADMTQINFNLNGTTDTTNITKATVYYTGNTNQFDTTVLFGSLSSPGNLFSISGSQDMLKDTNYFWLAVDIAANSTSGNSVDAEVLDFVADGSQDTPSITAPKGKRVIATPMTFSDLNATQYTTGQVGRGSYNNEIIGIEVDMSSTGAQVPLTQLALHTGGSTNPSTDITRARLYYTGGQSYFDSAIYKFGSSITNPNASMVFNGSVYLQPGTNYFWLTYDIAVGATLGDSVDAILDSAIINGSQQSATVSDPAGERFILNNYCVPVHPACGTTFIDGVIFGSISNTKSGCSSLNGNGYNDYPQSSYYTAVNKGNAYNLTVNNSNQNQSYSLWGDWNQNGTFDAGEWTQIHNGNQLNANASITKSITIPCSATKGWTKIRLRSRGVPANNGAGDACTQFGSGETEDYVIYVTDSQVFQKTTVTASSADVATSSTNNVIVKIQMMASNCASTPQATDFYLRTAGSTSASADITNAKMWYTGAVDTFKTTTQFGSTSTSPSGAMNFSGTANMTVGINYFWLSYDIASGATNGNFVDAVCDSFKVSSKTYLPEVTAPSGNRKIAALMTFSDAVSFHKDTTPLVAGSTGNQILTVAVVMNQGASVNLTDMTFNAKGSTSITNDITNAQLYSSGSSKAFNIATSTKVGNTITALTSTFTFTGSVALIPDTNWFWLVYDITAIATGNDLIDAECVSMKINSINNTPSVTAPSGSRSVLLTYCVPGFQNGGCNNWIQGVTFNNIKNLNTGCTSTTANRYNNYPYTAFTTTVLKNSKYELKMTAATNGTQIFGVWIDFNQNSTFDANEFYNSGNAISANANDSITITIPCTAKLGYTRMRIRSRSSQATITSTDPCTTNFGSGEAEDYTILIENNDNTGALGKDKMLCAGSLINLSPGGGFVSYDWSTGDTTSSVGIITAGTYYVTYKSGSGCVNIDTILITDAAPVTVSVGNDTSICNGGPATFNAGTGYTSYLWNTGDTTQKITVTTPGYYYATVTNTDGCTATDTVELIKKQPANFTLGVDKTICVGFTTDLDPGSGLVSYLWSTGATTQKITVSTAGTYKVTVVDNGGCVGEDSIDISVSTAMTNFGNDITTCFGNDIILDAGNNSTYKWNTGATTQTIKLSNVGTGTFIVDVVDQYGCKATDTIMATINPLPTLNLGPDKYICNGGPIALDAGSGQSTYAWNTGAATQIINVTTAGTFGLIITSPLGCTASDSITLTASSVSVNAGPDKTYCEGNVDSFFVAQGYGSYSWKDLSNGTLMSIGNYFTPAKSGTYSITVSNSVGCTATDTVMATINPMPDASFTYAWISSVVNSVKFTPSKTGQGTYKWDFGDGGQNTQESPIYTYPTFGTYKVTLLVTTPAGCAKTFVQSLSITGVWEAEQNDFAATVMPNPFNEQSIIQYTLKQGEYITAQLYDIQGNLVETLYNGKQESGKQQLFIDGGKLAAGLYMIRIAGQNSNSVIKVSKTE
ncbi:MAG: BNR-repeat neuraminidase N-terminal domain-containing protein [Bacteroidota bacterium]|nr:BNR-repeat neuraminidase N-terminal domain-containing protein [Bacteroidota bacterium]